MYKALRVPITLLHQKVYDTSTRLDKLVPLEVAKPRAVTTELPRLNAEEVRYMHYLRRFFLKVDSHTLMCRVCKKLCKGIGSRSEHYTGACWDINQALFKALSVTDLCAVCDDPILLDKVPDDAKRDKIPVCSSECLEMWDHFEPDSWKQERALYDAKYGE